MDIFLFSMDDLNPKQNKTTCKVALYHHLPSNSIRREKLEVENSVELCASQQSEQSVGLLILFCVKMLKSCSKKSKKECRCHKK